MVGSRFHEKRATAPWETGASMRTGRLVKAKQSALCRRPPASGIHKYPVEFGTVSRPDLVAAAREAGDADFDVLIACAFNYDNAIRGHSLRLTTGYPTGLLAS